MSQQKKTVRDDVEQLLEAEDTSEEDLLALLMQSARAASCDPHQHPGCQQRKSCGLQHDVQSSASL